MSRIRIQGLVKIMNETRRGLSHGIPPGEVADFRARVTETVTWVEEVCRQHRVKPSDLPSPSYRAYRYLKDLDLAHLPVREAGAPPPPRQLRIQNLVANCNQLHRDLQATVAKRQKPPTPKERAFEQLLARLAELAETVERICEQESASPADLPGPSRRAYQWLAFLSQPENLAAHLAALRAALHMAKTGRCQPPIPKDRRKLPVELRFDHTAALYRARLKGKKLAIALHEGFIDAPERVIRALVCTALSGKAGRGWAPAQKYALSDSFAETALALEMSGVPVEERTQGQYHDLEETFKRVNQICFQGEMPRPRLTWNRTLTHQKLGHYQPATDQLMISVTLDRSDVPPYALDFVMYHELLHKALGVTLVNGRRQIHTPEFRRRERAFEGYERAQTFLNDLISKISN